MMPKLIPKQVQVNYLGLFSKPAFSSWGDDKKILGGLFEAFSPFDITVGDINYDSSSSNLGDATLTVDLFNYSANYEFKLDRVQAVFNDFTEEQFPVIPEVLQRGDEWLRSVHSDFSFQSHLFIHASHNQLSDGNLKFFLQGLSNVDIPGIGINAGHGVTFHWDIPDRNWKLILGIDHSFNVADGIFIQFLLRTSNDKMDYVEDFQFALTLGRSALAKIDLEIDGIG